ncbi:hypothetical protein R6Z07F_013634 [Ovis aries]
MAEQDCYCHSLRLAYRLRPYYRNRSCPPGGEVQSHAVDGLKRRNSRLRSGSCVVFVSPGARLYKTSDLTQKPELHVPGTLAAGGPATLACSFRGAYKETKALFVSWKGPNVSACTDGSSNSSSPYPSSLVLHFTLKPKDRRATLRCHLNFYLAHLPGSSMVRLQVASPARLLYFSCSLEKTLQCSCSFRGTPTPSVRWLMGGDPVDLNSMHKNFQVTSNIAAPWANSTISLLGEPEIVTGLHCEGRNPHGIHTSSIFLIPPDKNSVSNALVKGLIQGVVYGSIATALFFFFLVLLAMKMLKWWEESHIPKASEALIPEKPEMLEEPKIPQESAAEPSPASVAEFYTVWVINLSLLTAAHQCSNVSNQSLMEDLVCPLSTADNTTLMIQSLRCWAFTRVLLQEKILDVDFQGQGVMYIVFKGNANLPSIERGLISLLSTTVIANLVCSWVL